MRLIHWPLAGVFSAAVGLCNPVLAGSTSTGFVVRIELTIPVRCTIDANAQRATCTTGVDFEPGTPQIFPPPSRMPRLDRYRLFDAEAIWDAERSAQPLLKELLWATSRTRRVSISGLDYLEVTVSW